MRAVKLAKLSLVILVMAILTACNSGSLTEGLESARNQPQQPVGNAPAAAPESASQLAPTAENQVAALPTGKAVAFLPVSNAPQSAISTLSASIRNAAAANQVPIVESVQSGASYQVKGYFSALEDGSGTLLVYVWDVLDRNNKRVYRISGQEQTTAKSADPWSSVTPQMIDRVAVSTLSQLKSWLSSSG